MNKNSNFLIEKVLTKLVIYTNKEELRHQKGWISFIRILGFGLLIALICMGLLLIPNLIVKDLLIFLFFIISGGYSINLSSRRIEHQSRASQEIKNYNIHQAIKDQEFVEELSKFSLKTLELTKEHIRYLIKKLEIRKNTNSSFLSIFSFSLLALVIVGSVYVAGVIRSLEITSLSVTIYKINEAILNRKSNFDLTTVTGLLTIFGIIFAVIQVISNLIFDLNFEKLMTKYEKCLSLLEKAKIIRSKIR